MNPIYTMPHILTETSEGATAHSLQDELFQDRQIELVGEITSESAYAIMLQLRYLQKADPAAPITLYINSPGGEVSSGLALYDVMQAVKCPVRTVCLGTAFPRGFIRIKITHFAVSCKPRHKVLTGCL